MCPTSQSNFTYFNTALQDQAQGGCWRLVQLTVVQALLASLNRQGPLGTAEESLLVCLMSVMRNWWWRPCLHFPFKYTCQRGRRTQGLPSDKSIEKWELLVETGQQLEIQPRFSLCCCLSLPTHRQGHLSFTHLSYSSFSLPTFPSPTYHCLACCMPPLNSYSSFL